MRTKVAIIGAGPAGRLLGQLLHGCGIDNVVLERQTADHVLGRIRAGLLEESTVALLDEAGAGQRAHHEGPVHHGIELAFGGARHRIDMHGATGKTVMIYGQAEVTLDLMGVRKAAGLATIYQAADVKPRDFDTDHSRVSWVRDGVGTRSPATSSQAATVFTASAAPASMFRRSRPSNGSTRSAGSASCRNRSRIVHTG